MLVDVIGLICRSEHFRLIDVIDADGFEYLRFDEVSDAAFGHHGDGDRFHDLLDHIRVTHAIRADIRGDAFQSHHGAGTGILCDLGVFDVDHIHDHAALQHLSQPLFYFEGTDFLFHNPSLLAK